LYPFFKCPSNAQSKPILPIFWPVSARHQADTAKLALPPSWCSHERRDRQLYQENLAIFSAPAVFHPPLLSVINQFKYFNPLWL
jgi:hypothetical protein